jgi:hypothetical protein
MRRLLCAALVLVGGCAKTLGGSDVELSINARTTAIPDADVASVHALELTLSGIQNDHTRYDLTRALSRQERLVIHLTKSTGDLTIAVLARDDQGHVVALGNIKSTLSGSEAHVIDVDLEPPPGGAHAASAVSINPDHVQLFTGQTVPLGSESAVTWSVAGGGAGGTIDGSGVYTAPAGAGSDSVEAVSTLYFGEHASATIDVLATGVVRYAGLSAGAGTVDGTGADARIAFAHGIAFDGAGHAFFSDNGNVIRQLDVASGAVTTIAGTAEHFAFADATGPAAAFYQPWGVAYDQARGALYIADSRTVRKLVLATGAVTSLAGNDAMAGSNDGIGSAAGIWNVWGLTYDGSQYLYFSEVNANTVRRVDVSSGAVTTLAGVPFMTGSTDGAGASALFNFPNALALDGQGALYIGDSHNQLIRKLDLATKMVSTVTGKVGVAGDVDGPKGTATIGYPDEMAYDGMGSLILNNRRIDVASGTVTSFDRNLQASPIGALAFAPDGKLWAGTNTALETVDPAKFELTPVAGVHQTYGDHNRVDGSRLLARFNGIQGVAVAPDGTLIVRDGESVRRVDLSTGMITALFVANPYIGGSAGVSVAGDGTIYFPYNDAIASLSPSDNYVSVHMLAGGVSGYADGSLAQARFTCPQDVVAVGKVLYVADSCNGVIRAVDLQAGMVSTFAGTANMGGLVDMPGAAARFNFPQGITADGNGNLYVASNNAVRKIVIAGAVVSTIAGGDSSGFADGSGIAAKFSQPTRLTLDASKQNLYVTDLKNTAIRKVSLGGVVTTVAGAVGKAFVTTGALPGTINEPGGVAVTPSGDLFVVVPHEEALLQIRLP